MMGRYFKCNVILYLMNEMDYFRRQNVVVMQYFREFCKRVRELMLDIIGSIRKINIMFFFLCICSLFLKNRIISFNF